MPEMTRIPASSTTRARICVPTWRRVARKVFHTTLFEAQEALAAMDDVDLVAPAPGPWFPTRERWVRRLLNRDPLGYFVLQNPGFERVRLHHDYDLFIGMCQTYEDLLYLNSIENWKERCRVSVLWLDEIWAASIPKYARWLEMAKRFDHVLLGFRGSVGPMSKALNKPCHWVPVAVDMERFLPYVPMPARAIDVLSIGRRWPQMHDALLAASRRSDLFYVYDSIRAGNAEVIDPAQHRDLFASMAKRTRFFLVAPAKMDAPDETRGQVEIGYRYYEAVAAGAVMVGQPPESASFRENFEGPDAVADVRPDGSDVVQVIKSLIEQPERIDALSRRNISWALLRHDWVYRWMDVLTIAGLPSSAAMLARRERLRATARAIGAPNAGASGAVT
jgi:hypothetical protein